jgi:hypothetical protein
VVKVIEDLALPRYGLANYLKPKAEKGASDEEKRILANLNRAGKRLIGFCRTNLFKRLESSGQSFLLSVQRHMVRNLITLHALENGLPIPIGAQDAAMLDTAVSDADEAAVEISDSDNIEVAEATEPPAQKEKTWDEYQKRAGEIYKAYRQNHHHRFDWLGSRFFLPQLADALRSDTQALRRILERAGQWQPAADTKLHALRQLVTNPPQ